MRQVEERSPKMQGVVIKLEERVIDIKARLRENYEALESIQASNERLQNYKDHSARRAHIMGRISLYLESLPQLEDTSGLKKDIDMYR